MKGILMNRESKLLHNLLDEGNGVVIFSPNKMEITMIMGMVTSWGLKEALELAELRRQSVYLTGIGKIKHNPRFVFYKYMSSL